MSALSDALNEANKQGWSTRQIAEKSGLNHATVAKYLNGTHAVRPDEETLKALSEVFRIPLERLRELAGLQPGEPDPYVPPQEAARLTRRQRRAVDEVIRSMLDPTEKVGGGRARSSAPMKLPPSRSLTEVEEEIELVEGDLADLEPRPKQLQRRMRPIYEQQLADLRAERERIIEWEGNAQAADRN